MNMVYQHDPEDKAQPKQRLPREAVVQSSSSTERQSGAELMTTGFWDAQGILL